VQLVRCLVPTPGVLCNAAHGNSRYVANDVPVLCRMMRRCERCLHTGTTRLHAAVDDADAEQGARDHRRVLAVQVLVDLRQPALHVPQRDQAQARRRARLPVILRRTRHDVDAGSYTKLTRRD